MSWKMVKIPEVLFFMEGPGVRNTQFTTKGVKLLNVGNINDGLLDLDSTTKFISETEAYGKYKHFLVEEGDLLIASSGIVVDNFHNKITWATTEDLPLCMNTSTIRFKTLDINILDIRFFSYFLKTKLFTDQLRKLITGSAQLNFGPSHLKQISLPLPPLPIQKCIAEILDAADALKRKDQELLKKYDELAQAIFIDMFGDPVRNEKGWEVKKLHEVCSNIFGGGTPSKSNPKFYIGNIPWITPKDMKSEFIGDSIDHINQLAVENSSTKLIPINSVLMVIRSGILKHTLPVAINTKVVTINQDMKAYIPDENLTNAIFLKYFFNCVSGFLLGKVRAVTADNIEFEQIKTMDFICPSIQTQNLFSEKIKLVIRQKNEFEKSSKKSDTLFQTLIQKAFKGELVS